MDHLISGGGGGLGSFLVTVRNQWNLPSSYRSNSGGIKENQSNPKTSSRVKMNYWMFSLKGMNQMKPVKLVKLNNLLKSH